MGIRQFYNERMTTQAEARPGAPLRTEVLENGLKVMILEEHTAPLASVWCWYKVGSRDERSGLTGVSHWVEHMNFKGTTNIPRDQVKGIIEQFGGFWNGYTWIDQTTYVETASRDVLDRMLFIEAERMGRALYDPADCESERTVIISELQGGENDPDTFLDQELTAAAFKAHPYRHPTIGWLADLESMTRDDLYHHYRRHYVPNNATLVIAGDVDPDEVMERVQHHFGAFEAGPEILRIRTREPEQSGERRVTIRREGTAAYLKFGFHAPAVNDPMFVPALLLDAALAGAKGVNLWSSFRIPPPQRSTRLYRGLVERGLASSVQAALLPTAEPFLYTVSITVNEGTPVAAVEETALALLEHVRARGITTDEVVRAKRQLYARMVFDEDSITNVAHQLGYFETISSMDTLRQLPGLIASASVDQVNAAAAALLKESNRTVGRFEPLPVGSGEAVQVQA
jgi:zinc protease